MGSPISQVEVSEFTHQAKARGFMGLGFGVMAWELLAEIVPVRGPWAGTLWWVAENMEMRNVGPEFSLCGCGRGKED